MITRLDDEPALDCLLRDLGVDADEPRGALPALRQTLVGLSDADAEVRARGEQFGADTRVRHLIGIDPLRGGIAIADVAEAGMQLAFCQRHTEAARRDLVRICAEIREELEPQELPIAVDASAAGAAAAASRAAARQPIAGAIYVSCAGRGGPHFGAPSAELAIVRHALGDVPLAGFFAAGEIARHHLYGYTGRVDGLRCVNRDAPRVPDSRLRGSDSVAGVDNRAMNPALNEASASAADERAARARRQAEVVARARPRCCRRMRCSGSARTPCPTNATASPPTASSRSSSRCPKPSAQVAGGAARLPSARRAGGRARRRHRPLGRRAAAPRSASR